MNRQEQPQRNRWLLSRKTIWVLVLLGFIAVGAFFLLTGHSAHVLAFLPFALFLCCPLMMLFMHHGDGNQDGHAMPKDEPPQGG